MKSTQLTLFCFIFLLSASAQFTNVLISPVGCTEPSICIDPGDVSRMVAATNCAYSYFSVDSGQTWDTCTGTIPRGVWAYDPCVVADTAGNFYYFHNYFDVLPIPITMQKSFNGGQNWGYDNNVPSLYDKEMACVSPLTNNLYVTYLATSINNVAFSRSGDGGVTWTPSIFLNSQTYPSIQFGAAPAVGLAPGEVYTVWANNTGIIFQKSIDNGVTWLPLDVNVSNFFSSSNGYNCMPSIATDLSTGSYSGNIYLCWWELDASGTDTDIYLAKSTNNGSTWTLSTVVSDLLKDQQWPQICIDQISGYIYIVYYEGNSSTFQSDIKLAFSMDGGNTFNHVPVSDAPATVTNWYHHYIGNAAQSGVIRPAWTSNDSLYTALISQAQLDQWLGTHDIDELRGLNIFPNPSAGIFYINSERKGELTIMNSTGAEVFSQTIREGQTTFDITKQAAGLYIVSVKTVKGIMRERIIKR